MNLELGLTAWQIVLWEMLGTGVMMTIGCGTVANNMLRTAGGRGGGWLMCACAWAFGVFTGATIADPTGAHLNPAVTLGFAMVGTTPWAAVPAYITGELLGGFLGATLAYLSYKKQFDTHDRPQDTRAIFCTAPFVRSYGWNVLSEVIATFVLIFWILHNPAGNRALGYAAVAFVILAIGTGLGGSTAWALNPARDLPPRIVYALLPIKGKGSRDWAYSWVPVVGPMLGGGSAAALTLLIG